MAHGPQPRPHRSRGSPIIFILTLLAALTPTLAFHLGDDENHCWVDGILTVCPAGFDLLWIQRPPETLVADTPFNASYALKLGQQVLPAPPHLIAHANLHACPLDIGFCDVNVRNGTVATSGNIVTQEPAQVSNDTIIFSTLRLAPGKWVIVGHLRVFNDTLGKRVQLDVARGVYRNVPRTTCAPGTYRDAASADTGTAICSICPPGTFSNATDSPRCTPCAAGTFQPDQGKDRCLKCPEGNFQDRTGQTACVPCPGFTFAEDTRTKCLACPVGSYSVGAAKSIAECLCEQGFYGPGGGNGTCLPCPYGGVCCTCDPDPIRSFATVLSNFANGLPACQTCRNGSLLPNVRPGFFPASESPNMFYLCEPEEACSGGPAGAARAQFCAAGYEGERCGKCTKGYYLSYKGECEECGSNALAGVLLIAFFALLAAILAGSLIMVLAEECSDAGAIIFIMFQIFDLCRRYRSVWPNTTSSILFSAALFNLDLTFFRMDCLIQTNHLEHQIYWAASPFAIIFIQYSIFFLIYLYRRWHPDLLADPKIPWGVPPKPGSHATHPRRYPFDLHRPFRKLVEVPDVELWRIRDSWVLFTMVPLYTIFVSRAFVPFNCGEVLRAPGVAVSFLKENRDVKCGDARHGEMIVPSLVLFVVGCIVPPVASFAIMFTAKARGWLSEPSFYQRFWPIYAPFSHANYFWMGIKLSLLLIFHSTHSAFRSDSVQMTAGALVLLLELTLIAWRRPYEESFICHVHFVATSGAIAFLIFAKDLAGLSKRERGNQYDVTLTSVLALTIAAVFALLAVSFLMHFLPKSHQGQAQEFHRSNAVLQKLSMSFLPSVHMSVPTEEDPGDIDSIIEKGSRRNSKYKTVALTVVE
ncbi:hypothetical protein HDU96_007598 [Phlyctochytrium bullatum]|nr:hypothetical protein HDU96_007598 [Phlyctochytrium bullatum]